MKERRTTEVPIGELVVAGSEDTLTCQAIGSCVVIILYDPKYKVSALIHAMLPSSKAHTSMHLRALTDDVRYVDTAIDDALKRMLGKGSKREDLEAKLVGGANMFGLSNSDIGTENVLSAKEKLKKEGIKLIGECVGGSQGRSVEFCVETGIVAVKTEF
ncbi:MAG: chemotaxis protein CheD [Candidatus Omnitrophota bacterium]